MTNAGVALADGEILVFVEPDAVPHGDCLTQLLAPFADPGSVAVSGPTFLR